MKTNPQNLPLSVSIISFNEEDRIRETLESIKDLASEIVIVDSFSSDSTVKIAEEYGAKVYKEEWHGFAEQKNISLLKCNNDWVLCLDCDEIVTDVLVAEIRDIVTNNSDISGYYINRRTVYLDKILKKAWQPDTKLRLAKRSSLAEWHGSIVHEELKVNGKTSKLSGELLHKSYKNIEDHMFKTIKYARLSAESYYKRGRKPSLIKLIFTPPYSFFKLYVLHLGFIDGVQGFIAGFSAFMYSFLKYSFLWDMVRNEKKK